MADNENTSELMILQTGIAWA